MKYYRVVCEDCGESRRIGVISTQTDDRIDWLDDKPDESIVSGRKRLDGQFGFECLCGNNTLLSQQEARGITNKVNPDPQQIKDIIDNLIPERTNFKMEAA